MTEVPKATSKVFVSYSRRNKEFAKKLNDSLDSNGVDAWVDWEGIPLSSDWMDEITRAIEAADAFLFIISPDSLASEVCGEELELGLKYNKKLVPILYLEPEKGQSMHEQLAATNWVYMREQDDYESTVPALIDTIQTDLGWVRNHTRILLRAKEWAGKDKDNSFLLQGSDLGEAESWMVEASADDAREVLPLQGEYIQTSRMAATKRQRNLLIGVSLALVVSIGMAIFAMFQRTEAVRNEKAAATARVEAEHNADIAATQQVIAEDNAAEAKAQQAIAEQNAIQAQAQSNAAKARVYQTQPGDLDLSTLLAIDSWQAYTSDLAEDILRGNASISPVPLAQMSHGDVVNCIKESPDGNYFVTASDDGSVCLWMPEDGTKKLCVQHEDGVYDVVFSADSSYFISGSYDGVLNIWSVEDGSLIKGYEFDGAAIWDMDIHPDGTQIAVARDDGYVSLIDLTDLDAEPRNLQFESAVYKAVYSPDGEWLGVGTSSGKTFLWNAEDYFYEGAVHTDEVYALDFSTDSRWMISGGADSVVRVTEVSANGLARSVMQHGDWIEFVEFSPSGNWFAAASDDNSLRIWDAETGAEKLRMEHKGFVMRIDISDNGAWIASTGNDQTARVWDTASGSEMLRIPLGGRGSAILFNETATRLLVGDSNGNLTLWDTSSLLARMNIIKFPELVHEARYAPDGLSIAVNTDQRNVWSIPIEDTLSLNDGTQGEEVISTDALTYDLTYSPDSNWVAAAASRSNKVVLYNSSVVENKEEGSSAQSEIVLDAKIYAIDFSPDSTQLATADQAGHVRFWDLASGEEVGTLDNGQAVRGVAYHPDGKNIAASIYGQIIIWDIASQSQTHTLNHPGSLDTIVYSKDGSLLATASSEGSIYLWDVHDNYTLLPNVLEMGGAPYSMAISPDNHYVAAGSTNYNLYVWDIVLGDEISRIPHSDVVTGVEFSPDGTELMTAARKDVQLWDFPALPIILQDTIVETACSRLLTNMNQTDWDLTHSSGEEYRPLCPALGVAD